MPEITRLLTSRKFYAEVAALILLALDHLATLKFEWKCIWRGPLGLVNILYLISRYTAVITLITHHILIHKHLANPPVSPETCRRWILSLLSVANVILVVLDTVLFLRIYALYQKRKWVFLILIPIFAQPIVAIPSVHRNLQKEGSVDGICNADGSMGTSFAVCFTILFTHIVLWLATFIQRNIALGHAAVVKLVVIESTWALAIVFALMAAIAPYSSMPKMVSPFFALSLGTSIFSIMSMVLQPFNEFWAIFPPPPCCVRLSKPAHLYVMIEDIESTNQRFLQQNDSGSTPCPGPGSSLDLEIRVHKHMDSESKADTSFTYRAHYALIHTHLAKAPVPLLACRAWVSSLLMLSILTLLILDTVLFLRGKFFVVTTCPTLMIMDIAYALYQKRKQIFWLLLPVAVQPISAGVSVQKLLFKGDLLDGFCNLEGSVIDAAHLGGAIFFAHFTLWLATFHQRNVARGQAVVVKLVVQESAWALAALLAMIAAITPYTSIKHQLSPFFPLPWTITLQSIMTCRLIMSMRQLHVEQSGREENTGEDRYVLSTVVDMSFNTSSDLESPPMPTTPSTSSGTSP
ncbi:hypothetical protein CVT24_005104 [Panaeolus cyanescens]|uniref:DUF6533 domain-containing protein n=1 Tax=Panaeolus cyanescens TaxID=181874 RepID=A0A409VPY0_9AGAR|nr:hypothetical protein CVT24_005104 [Panaeolus cyanescens]